MLHCKIIRDADKIDIFKTGLLETFEAFLDAGQEILENDIITESIYETFMNSESILVPLVKLTWIAGYPFWP